MKPVQSHIVIIEVCAHNNYYYNIINFKRTFFQQLLLGKFAAWSLCVYSFLGGNENDEKQVILCSYSILILMSFIN